MPFLVTVKQGGKTLVKEVYGRRTSLKVWPFGGDRMGCGGPGLVAECAWPYGATENMVWEGEYLLPAVFSNCAAMPAAYPRPPPYCIPAFPGHF